MEKVLFVATVTSHINAFHLPYLKWFKEQGYEVHVASKGNQNIEYCDKHFEIPFERFPLKKDNLNAYRELKRVISENNYKIIHCHTPVGGFITRLVAKKTREKGTKVIYTAHGFHFYKGAPIINWLVYYPIEKIMAHYTDCLITINKEDYEIAKKKLKTNRIEYIHGVGMNTERFHKKITKEDRVNKRKELGIKEKDIVFTYVAELNRNKNQIFLIEVIEKLKKEYKNIKLLLVGNCNNKKYYEEEIKKRKLVDEVVLLGKRKDIPEILSITNIYLASSIREGLPVNIMEAMYMGLPIIATDNRGHRELVKSENGFIIHDRIEMISRIKQLINDKYLCHRMKSNSRNIVQDYLIEEVLPMMERIYVNVVQEKKIYEK